MTNITKISLTIALTLGAGPVFAGNGDLDQLRLQLRDGSCVVEAEELLEDEGLTIEQLRLRLRDRACLVDGEQDAEDATPAKNRLRIGEENGQGDVWRHREEGGAEARAGGGRN